MSKIINIQVEAGDSKSITQELTQVGSTLVRVKCERGTCKLYSTSSVPADADGHRVITAGDLLTLDASLGIWVIANGSSEGADLSVDSASETISSGGAISELAPDMSTPAQFLAAFNNFEGLFASDMVFADETANGRPFMALSVDQDTPHTTEITMNSGVNMPCAVETEVAIVNRGGSVSFSNYLGSEEDVSPIPDQIIKSISQTGNKVTVIMPVSLVGDFSLGSTVSIYGVQDDRLNYQNAVIDYMSQNRLQFTFTCANEVSIPSLSIASITTANAYIRIHRRNGGSRDSIGMQFIGPNPERALLLTRDNGNMINIDNSAGLLTIQSSEVGSTLSVNRNTASGLVEITASSRYRTEARPGWCTWTDKYPNTYHSYTVRGQKTSAKPSHTTTMYPKLFADVPMSASRVVAKIAKIVKSASTTATVTTLLPHGLVTGNYVSLLGVLDQTNFAGSNTPAQITKVNDTTFTITWGISATATSYGGVVQLICGSCPQTGFPTNPASAMNNIQWQVYSQVVVCTGVTTWTGFNVGDLVDIIGTVFADNTASGLDGIWRIYSVSGTNMVLKAVTDVFGVVRSPVPAGTADISKPCGGTVRARPTMRTFDVALQGMTEQRTYIEGQGTAKPSLAVPVISAKEIYYVKTAAGLNVIPVGSLADFFTDPMPPDSSDECQVYAEFFSDSAGLIPVTPTTGSINIAFSPLGNIFLAPVNAAAIDATKCGTTLASYTPPYIGGRMVKGKASVATAVTGAAYAKIGFWRY